MFDKVEPIEEQTKTVERQTETETKTKTKSKPKKEKAPKVKKPKAPKDHMSPLAVIIPFLCSIALVVALYIIIGTKTESSVATLPVMYASQDIAKNTYIKAEDYEKYFKICETDASLIPSKAISGYDVLPKDGVYVKQDQVLNQMTLVSALSDTDLVMDKYFGDTIQEFSIATSSFKNSDSGRIRHGDIVNIFAKDPDSGELVLHAKDIYVENAYDANGNLCSDDTGVAVSFNVWAADEMDIMGITQAIMHGDVQISLTREK